MSTTAERAYYEEMYRRQMMTNLLNIDPFFLTGLGPPAIIQPSPPPSPKVPVVAPVVTTPLEKLLLSLRGAADVVLERAGAACYITFTFEGATYQLELTQPEHLNADHLTRRAA